jgi:hypothetical protein
VLGETVIAICFQKQKIRFYRFFHRIQLSIAVCLALPKELRYSSVKFELFCDFFSAFRVIVRSFVYRLQWRVAVSSRSTRKIIRFEVCFSGKKNELFSTLVV